MITTVANIVAVAKLAKLYALPIVLSTVNVTSRLNTPTIRQLAEVLAGIDAFDRTTINAWECVSCSETGHEQKPCRRLRRFCSRVKADSR